MLNSPGKWAAVHVLLGIAYGSFAARIPAPESVHVFWLGNLCAPWVLLPYLAGRSQTRSSNAALVAVLVATSCVLAFYARGVTADPVRLRMEPGVAMWQAAVVSATRITCRSAPWLLAALLAGLVLGPAGMRAARVPGSLWRFVPAVVLLAEPLCWRLSEGFLPSPVGLWLGECSLGLVLLGIGARWTQPTPVTSSTWPSAWRANRLRSGPPCTGSEAGQGQPPNSVRR